MSKNTYLTHNRFCVVEDFDCPDTLKELKEWVDNSIQRYGEDTQVRLEVPRWEDEGHTLNLYQLQPKTKEELEEQEKQFKKQALAQEQRERELVLQLQKKFANG